MNQQENLNSKVRIKDIANFLNVSIATVDRALHNRGRINSKTKELILKKVKELNYRPDILARALKTNKSYLIGIIIHWIDISYHDEILQGIEDVLKTQDYSMILCTSDNKFEEEKKYINLLQDKSVDGIIILPCRPVTQTSIEVYQQLKDTGIPFVFILERVNGINVPNIITNEYSGAVSAVEHLIKEGHRKIAHIKGPDNCWITDQRLNGYTDTIKKYNLDLNGQFVKGTDFTFESGYTATKQLLGNGSDRPTAIFACGDIVAMGAYKAIKELGLKIPDDISLVGFDNLDISGLIDVPLTTISQPKYALGKASAEKLMQMIESKNKNNGKAETLSKDIVFEPELIIRQSTRSI